MSAQVSNNKKIAKNAAALYFRMIATMLVGLYTSRIVLNALGVEDYGIYNVVGGFVAMFALVTDSIQGSVSRFLTFELGIGDQLKLRRVFSTSILVLLGLSIVVVFLAESVGLWYLYNKMVVPEERMDAAFWCFQLSVLTFVLTMINSPYTSAIIAHERMDVYAYLTIFGVVFKLLLCFAIVHSPIDRLVFYAFLLCFYGFVNQIVYVIFCKRNFKECRFKLILDKSLFKDMFSFAGWNFIGSSATVLRGQGVNLLLNIFGGPVVNAANGIANSICSMVSTFVNNFTQAFNPQITKRYAAQEYESLMNLIIYGSKYSYYLMFVLALPVFFNAHYIFNIWLGIVPEYSVDFTRWILVYLLAESISKPIITAKNATGNIRNYQIVVGGIQLLMLPISYIGVKFGLSVTFVAITNAFTSIVAIFARLYMLKGDFPLWSSRQFFFKVIGNVIIVSVLSSIIPFLLYNVIPSGTINFFVTSVFCVLCTILSILYIGCTKSERIIIVSKLNEFIRKFKRKI